MKILIPIVLIVILFGGFYYYRSFSAPAPAGADSKSFDLIITGRKIVSGPETLQVRQGDTITITATITDEDEEFHVHGYDRSMDLKKGEKGSLSFVADASGRFMFELEESKAEIGAIEVLP